MKSIKYLIIFTLSLFVMSSCEDGPTTSDINFVSFQGASFSFPVDIDGTNEFPISIYATQVTSSDRTFAIKVNTTLSTADPASYNIPTSITIPANENEGILPITISDINIGVAGKKLILEFENEEGLFTGGSIQVNITQSCPGNEVFLDLSFDDYGSETSWELKNSSDNIVASGGSYKDGSTGFSTSFCLGAGTYTFNIDDAYGDGGASATIIKSNVTLVDILGSSYATSASKTFEVQ